jgi:hypothetical protein
MPILPFKTTNGISIFAALKPQTADHHKLFKAFKKY